MKNVVALLFLLGTLLFFGRVVLASAPPSKLQCITANEEADAQRTKGQLRAARASLLVCAHAACPKLVRDDCNLRIADVDKAMPTITFTARDGAQDISAVTVAMDGETIAKEADGKPINVDPGEHTFTFTKAGTPPQTQKLVIREGEKNRVYVVQFGEAPRTEVPTGRLVIVSGPGSTISVDSRTTVLGRFDAQVSAGSHDVHVSESGKIPATRIVEVKSGATETLTITLKEEKRSVLPWVIGGAVVVAAAAVVGGILLFSTDETRTNPPPGGSLGTIGIASFR